MHIFSHSLMADFVKRYLNPSSRYKIIDIGSADTNGSYADIFSSNRNWSYRGCDIIKERNVDIVLSDPYDWSVIPSGSFDVVISGQTFGHMAYPWLAAAEVERILKEGGLLCIIDPSKANYSENPDDYYRFTNKGLEAIISSAGLHVIESKTHSTSTWCDSIVIGRKDSNLKEEAKEDDED